MSKVNLIVGGVQKGGTTTIAQHLRQHPLVAFGDTKELHVASDKDRFADPDYDLGEAYSRRFTHLASGDVAPRYLVDATPVYCYWPNAIERLAAYNPAAKLVLIFRDPIERAFSHWKMEYARKTETKSFPEAIRSGRSRVMSDPTAPGFHRVFSYVERGFYADQLRRVYASFPRAQVLALETRTLSADVEGTLARLWSFLDINPPATPPKALRENTAFDVDYGYEFDPRDGEYLYRLFRWDIESFAELSGLDVSHWGAAYRTCGPIASASVLQETADAAVAAPTVEFHYPTDTAQAAGLHEAEAPFEAAPSSLEAECQRLREENARLQAELDKAQDKPRRWFGR